MWQEGGIVTFLDGGEGGLRVDQWVDQALEESGTSLGDLGWILTPLLVSLTLHWGAQICASDLSSPTGVDAT